MELKKFYKVLSTNSDGTLEFVSTMEGSSAVTHHCCWLGAALIKLSAAYSYPIYGTQWHPEKNPFEFLKVYIPRSPSAVRTSFYTAEFFVNEGRKKPPLVAAWRARPPPDLRVALICVLAARKNKHHFQSEAEERKALIYNYSPVYSTPNSTFVQIYYFWLDLQPELQFRFLHSSYWVTTNGSAWFYLIQSKKCD